eukprot:CAMPEP_0183746554 /NCGR_PEP_ID=MMETSP0737-20130205/66816_1 /TAXON_ID=385413 /ORGANISM="Thalassiosira miniscula, Strain CCMP1093" /LENGTH=536 /DNA_ID=CAMNT_0025982253 /DNA_START=483 /DNA_END=2091 /DNA_ORIENTATION=-
MDPSPPPPPLALSTPATATVDDAVAQPAEPPSPSPDTTTASPSSRSTNTTVTWANQIGGATSKATEKVAAGTTKMVGWTYEHAKIETATAARGLRPLHVRVSVRVHHVAFLHPGLDNGSRATISDGASRRWKKNKNATPPGLLQFGKQKGDWKNPLTPKSKPFSRGDSDLSNTAKLRKKLECEDGMDASEISEIISAEAFRLSRDGIIQHHYALNRTASPQQSSPADNQRLLPPRSPRFSLLKNSNKNNATTATTTQSNIHSSILSPYSCENPQEAARYYKECAERPKGYRRLVVSSVTPISDVKVPSSGMGANVNYAATSSIALLGSGGEFVATSTKSPLPTTTTSLHRPPETTEGSTSSLPVATNRQTSSSAEATTEATTEETTSKEQQFKTRRPLKILFLSSDTGGGHRASAEALANQFQRHFPGTTYDLMDFGTAEDGSRNPLLGHGGLTKPPVVRESEVTILYEILVAARASQSEDSMALDRAAAKAERGHDIADVPGNVDVVPLGFMTNMADWMVAADVLVSKAGPGTIA